MKSAILLGGLGTRLRPFTLDKPKPLLPILNKPFLSYQLAQLKKHGIREAVLALGHKAGHFRRHLGSGRAWGMRFIYSLEKEPLGTGGALRKALKWLTEPAFVLNGDIFSDIDLSRLPRLCRQKKAEGVINLVEVANPAAYGLVELNNQGRIQRFLEKPSADQITTRTVNAGCYFFHPRLLRQIPEGRAVSLEREVFPAWLSQDVPLFGYIHRGYWSDIGTLGTYWKTHMDLLKGKVLRGEKCRVAPDAVLEGSVSLGPGCVVEEKAFLSDCVVHKSTRIGAYARVQGAILGENSRIGAYCRVGPDQALANGTVLPAYTQYSPGMTQRTDLLEIRR